MKNYKEYTLEQYLNDDAFIRSILEPTEETRRYWDSLIDAGALDIYTYTDAVLILTDWKNNLPAVEDEDLMELWRKIDRSTGGSAEVSTPRSKVSRRLFIPLAAALAAAAVAAVIILPRESGESTPGEIKVDPGFVLKTVAQESNNVVIVSQQTEMELKGNHPEVNYDQQGLLSVDREYSETVVPQEGQEVPATGQELEWNKIVVPYGKMASLRLSDGSTLKINAGTTVTYPKTFAADSRDIHVDGEVFANIIHDGRPFTVHTDGMEVKVTGTCFDLSDYKDDDYSHVVLINGSVDVSAAGTLVSLSPRQAFMKSDGNTYVQMVNTDLYTSWTSGVYKFENEPVENVLVRLSRFYNVTLVLPTDPSGVICYGSLELKDDFKSILTGLMQLARFNFVIRDGAYTIQWVHRK